MLSQDQRPDYRVEFKAALAATIIAIDGTWQIPCRVEDISGSGAKLGIDQRCPVKIGREFFLLMANVGLVYRRCELVWVDGEVLGARFLGGSSKGGARAPAAASPVTRKAIILS